MSSRLDTLEGDMLGVRAALDGLQTTLRKLQGKIYRGVALGDTVDEVAHASPELVHETYEPTSKASLYEKASHLRRK